MLPAATCASSWPRRVGSITNAATTPTQAFLLPYGLRTVDGTYNNLVEGRETWGAADQPFPEMSSPQYVNEQDDAQMFGTPANPVWLTNNNYTPGSATGSPMLAPGTVVDADPRTISNLIADQTLNNPAAISAALTYAGITGAAQMTAISQIQAARVAITNAGTGVGNIPSLVASGIDAAEAGSVACPGRPSHEGGFSGGKLRPLIGRHWKTWPRSSRH